MEWNVAEVASLGNRDKSRIGVCAALRHAATGDFPFAFTDDVLGVIVMAGAAGEQGERESAFAHVLDGEMILAIPPQVAAEVKTAMTRASITIVAISTNSSMLFGSPFMSYSI